MNEVLDLASWVLLSAGTIFCGISGIGLLRMPDLYTRTHATSLADTLGAGLVLMGLLLQVDNAITGVKLVMVMVFIHFTSPVACHALVKAAYASGIKADGLHENEMTTLPSQDPYDDPAG